MKILKNRISKIMLSSAVTFVFILGAGPVKSQNRDFYLEISDFYYPSITEQENSALLSEFSNNADIIGHYYSSKNIRRLKLTSCMIGVTCYPDPHFENDVKTTDHPVFIKANKSFENASAPYRIYFSLPTKNKSLNLSNFEISFSIISLWKLPEVKSLVAKHLAAIDSKDSTHASNEADTRLTLDDLAIGDSSAASNFCLKSVVIHMPHAYTHVGLVSYQLAEILPNGKTVIHRQYQCVNPGLDSSGRISDEKKKQEVEFLESMHDF